MEGEYAAEVEKLEKEAAGRKAQARGRPQGAKSQGKQVSLETKKDDRRTDARRAKAAGTNRRYLGAAADLLDRAEDKQATYPAVAILGSGGVQGTLVHRGVVEG
jgi:hypothetical protein